MKAAKSERPPLARRPFRLVSEDVRERIISALRHLPIDELRPLEVVFQEEQKKRKLDANAAMWAGALRDLAEQAFIEGVKYSAPVWHEFAKKEFLPEVYDPELCMEGYEKWSIDPRGDRVLIGSTTQLTVKGMALYMEELTAMGAHLGVLFTTRGRE